jgi:hypothetical protein
MKMIKISFDTNYLIFLMMSIVPSVVFCASKSVYELNGSFGYSKQVYGDQRQNSFVERSYSSSFAVFFLTYTAVEFNYSEQEDIITEKDTIQIDTNTSIVSIQNKVLTNVYGIGIKQSLASLQSFIVPMFGLGHAKQKKSGGTAYTIRDNNGDRIYEVPRSSKTVDSTFASFTLKVNLSKRMAITGMVKTIFPSFEWNRARDSIKYEAGLSILF